MSSGIRASSGFPAAPSAIQAAYRLGLSLSGHKTNLIHARLVSTQNLILVMDAYQKEALQAEFPIFASRVYLLSEVVDNRLEDIPDPIVNLDLSPFQIAAQIKEMIERGFYRICARALHPRRS
jgi:protein-tyrosine-phosphatase